jgi:hypothetical protein
LVGSSRTAVVELVLLAFAFTGVRIAWSVLRNDQTAKACPLEIVVFCLAAAFNFCAGLYFYFYEIRSCEALIGNACRGSVPAREPGGQRRGVS